MKSSVEIKNILILRALKLGDMLCSIPALRFRRRESDRSAVLEEPLFGYRIINVPAGPTKQIPNEELLPHMDEFTYFILEFFFRRTTPCNIVHAKFWMSGLAAFNLKKITGVPFAITFHALGRLRRQYQGDQDAFPDERFEIEDQIVREADLIIAECPQDFEDLKNLYDADENQMVIIPCGFDPQEMDQVNKVKARNSIGVSNDIDLVLHLGEIERLRRVAEDEGEAICRRFARVGIKTIVADVSAEKARRVAGDIIKDGGKAYGIEFDVTDYQRIPSLMDEMVELCGGMDILINNAGIDLTVPEVILQILQMPHDSVIPEVMVLPMKETFWP